MTARNALDQAFESARQTGRGVLIPYLTGGYPQPEGFAQLAVAVLEAGADALEIGIPFSDPLLDGPSIQQSQQQALEAGVTPARCLELAVAIAARSEKPLIFMGAFNPILSFGLERFTREAAGAGVTALIVPDVPLEEQEDLREAANASGLHLIQLVAPTSSPERIRSICADASGFVYCISVAGVTGARRSVTDTARPLVEQVRACTNVPVAVGFGIAGPEQAREVARFADGVIVGSALINAMRDTADGDYAATAAGFIAGLRAALDPATSPA